MKFNYYDIESLSNLFTLANFKEQENEIDFFYLFDVDESMIDDDTNIEDYEKCLEVSLMKDSDIPKSSFQKKAEYAIYAANPAFNGKVNLYNLKHDEAKIHLAKTFGSYAISPFKDNESENVKYDKLMKQKEFRIVNTTDDDYDERIHPYFVGFNSYRYDTTILALFMYEAMYSKEVAPVKTSVLRGYNDDLFSANVIGNMPSYLRDKIDAKAIRDNMVSSGRFIDLTNLNESVARIALKKLSGMMGFQILESDKVGKKDPYIKNFDQFLDLVGYNVSDVVYLAKLFHTYYYYSKFEVKRGIIKKYPEIVFRKDDNTPPEIGEDGKKIYKLTNKKRKDVATIDSTSASLIAKVLSPFGNMTDQPYVSFMYPHKDVADALGIKQVNVLDEAKKFFYENIDNDIAKKKFDEIYNYYKSIEGKNFNRSKAYNELYAKALYNEPEESELYKSLLKGDISTITEPCDLASIPTPNMNFFYFDENSRPTSCYIKFSTGGIHGAELNLNLYKEHLDEYIKQKKKLKLIKKSFTAEEIGNMKIEKVTKTGKSRFVAAKEFEFTFTDENGNEITEMIPIKSVVSKKDDEYKFVEPKKPVIFKKSGKGKQITYKLTPCYKFSSSDKVKHEDFSSYYPNLLRMLKAFFNIDLNYDRYGEIYEEKERLGVLMADKSIDKETRMFHKNAREGNKLLLNAATGGADTKYDTSISMNNNIISMRIIGQIFTWRIGQAQTLKGARVISTNTDGLYACDEKNTAEDILVEQSKLINIKIDPEDMYLISKDSNNRIEVDIDENSNLTKISKTNGTSLCHANGPQPVKSLSHPAAIDRAIMIYLYEVAKDGVDLSSEFDEERGLKILKSLQRMEDKTEALIYFQNILDASRSSFRYPFAVELGVDLEDLEYKDVDKIRILNHYNRVFVMKDNTNNTYHMLNAVFKTISKSSMASRKGEDGSIIRFNNNLAYHILKENGVEDSVLRNTKDRETVIQKISRVEPEWFLRIENRDLNYLTEEEKSDILDNIDLDKYLGMLKTEYENNWKNVKANYVNDEHLENHICEYIFDVDESPFTDTITQIDKESKKIRKEWEDRGVKTQNEPKEKDDNLNNNLRKEGEIMNDTFKAPTITKDLVIKHIDIPSIDEQRKMRLISSYEKGLKILRDLDDLSDEPVSIVLSNKDKSVSINNVNSKEVFDSIKNDVKAKLDKMESIMFDSSFIEAIYIDKDSYNNKDEYSPLIDEIKASLIENIRDVFSK